MRFSSRWLECRPTTLTPCSHDRHRERGDGKHHTHPMPDGISPEFRADLRGCDRGLSETGVGSLEVQRKHSEYENCKKGRDREQPGCWLVPEPADQSRDNGQTRRDDLERPEEAKEKRRVLAVPRQEGLRWKGPPERDKHRPLGDECPGGETQGKHRKKNEHASHGASA